MKAAFASALIILCSACASQSGNPVVGAPGGPGVDNPQTISLGVKNELHPTSTIVTGGQPTPAQLEKAKAQGVNAVVNLRPVDEAGADPEERAKVEALGLAYFHIPVAGAAGVTLENALMLNDVLKSEANKPALVHCASGNRAGALFAVLAYHVDGKDLEAAIATGKRYGLTRLEAHLREKLPSEPRCEDCASKTQTVAE